MKCYEIVFSPTGGTKKVSALLTQPLSQEAAFVDLCSREQDFSALSLAQEDVAVIAVPSYGGRVPAVAAERLGKIKGNGARAILVCVYGNRDYEDTLAELEDVAVQAGFQVIAAVAAVAEHSIARQFATGRPDAQDAQVLQSFARKIQAKLSAGDTTRPAIPGSRPYKKASGAGVVPQPTKGCTQCGLCAAQCPVGAIDKNDSRKVDKKACISCMRCVSLCPNAARKINPLMLSAVGLALKKSCSQPKDNQLFL